MEVFPDVAKHVAQHIHKGELQHLQNWCSIKEIDQLALLKDDKITGYNINELLCGENFEISKDSYSQEFDLEFDDTKNLERGFGGFGGKVWGVELTIGLQCNMKVTWSAKFEKLTWKKLKNKLPLTEHLTHGKLDITHHFVKSTYDERSRFRRCPVLKVVDSILYTNSDTVVSITTEPLLDASVEKKISDGKEMKPNANYKNSGKETIKKTLPANTVMAFGCVNLMVDMSNGKMKVDSKGGFCGTPAPKDTNCVSGGSQPSSPGVTSSTKEAELNQKNAKLQEANEELQKLNADKAQKMKEMERIHAETIADKDETIAGLNQVIEELETKITKQNEEISRLKETIKGLKQELADQKAVTDSQGNEIHGLQEKFNVVLDVLKQPASQRSKDHINSLYSPAAAENETPSAPAIASNSLKEAKDRQAVDDCTSESTEVTDNDVEEPGNSVQKEKPQSPYDRQNEMRRQMQSQPQGTTDLGQQQEQRGPEISSRNGDTESHVNTYVESHVDRGADSTAMKTQTDRAVLTHEDSAICLYMNVRDDSNSCWVSVEYCICTMLIVADENNRQKKHPIGAVYAVAPAHMFLSSEQRNRGAAADISIINTLRQQILGASSTNTYHLSLKTAAGKLMNFDVSNSVLFDYRQQCLRSIARNPCPYDGCPVEDEVCHHMFMNDMALFPISYEYAVKIQQELETIMHKSVVGEVFNITSLSQFAELHESRTKIEVMHFNGNLEPLRSDERKVQGLGKHITFTLESGELGPGTAGALIYIKEKGECRPFGMLVGRLKLNSSKPIYQAVILNQAFKDIEKDYSHLLENIQPFRL